MFLGSRNDVLRQIRRITAAQPPDEALGMAVAFWGTGSQQLIIPDRRFQIICNLFHLGTNPDVIRQLKARTNVKIKHRRDLHAKAVVGARQAIVGPSNFSKDGLGMLGLQREGWLEAGSVLDSRDVRPWFDTHWEASVEVTDADLALAEQMWAARGGQGPGEAAPAAEESPLAYALASVPELRWEDVFREGGIGNNQTHMACGGSSSSIQKSSMSR